MDGLKISSAWGTGKEGDTSGYGKLALDSMDTIYLVFLQLVLTLTTAIAFFTAALLMIARIVALFFLMALSPIGFMGGIIPALKEHADDWRKTLYSQIMVAPVFLFFMFLTLNLIRSGINFNASSTPTGGVSIGLYFNYIMIIGIILLSVNITKKISGKVGAVFDKAGTAVAGFGLGLATGGVAMLGRKSIGAMATKAAENDGFKKWAANSRTGNMLLSGSQKLSKSTFDARNSKIAGSVVGQINKQTGLNMSVGKGGNKGFAQERDDYTKAQVERARALERGDLTEDQAHQEFKEENDKEYRKLNKLATEHSLMESQLRQTSDPVKKQKIQEQMSKISTEVQDRTKKLEESKKLSTSAEERGADGDYTEEAKKIRKERLERKKKEYQNKFADRIEKQVSRGWGYNKKAAGKIRKDVIKGKSDQEKLAEIAAKIEKERIERENASSNTSPGGSNTPAPATPPRP
jgi:hypothetical protein